MKRECKKIVSVILMISLLFTTRGFTLYAEENKLFTEGIMKDEKAFLEKADEKEASESQLEDEIENEKVNEEKDNNIDKEQKNEHEQDEQEEQDKKASDSELELQEEEKKENDVEEEKVEEEQKEEQKEEQNKEHEEKISSDSEIKEEKEEQLEQKEQDEKQEQKEENQININENKESSPSEVNSEEIKEEKEKQVATESIIIKKATKSTVSVIVEEKFLGDATEINRIQFADGNIPIDYIAPHIEEDTEDSMFDENLFGDSVLPVSYDSRVNTNPSNPAMSIIPPIRNQEKTNFCWAYSTIAVMETSLRRKGLVSTEYDAKLSEDAVVYSTYYNKDITNSTQYIDKPGVEGRDYVDRVALHGDKKFTLHGGNILFAIPMSSGYMGFVKDSNVPVNREGIEYDIEHDKSNGTDVARSYMGDLVFNSNDYELENAEYYNKDDRENIKKAIMRNGIVSVSYHAREDMYELVNFEHEIDGEIYYYIADNLALKSNHAINIIGWDDNIPKENFFCMDANGNIVNPKNNGAWLCRNNWGDTYGNGGYFWLSYEESTIANTMIAADVIEADTYKYNYHYDTTLAQTSWGIYKRPGYRHGNIYKISDDDEYQSIDAVSVGIDSANAKFDIEIWANENEMANPEDGTKLLSQLVRKEAAGYYTIELNKKPVLKKGTYFSVVVVPHSCSGTNFKIMQDANDGSYTYNEAAKKQSFTFYENTNTWRDRNQNLQEINGIKYGTNHRIKALTNSVTNVISFNGNGATNYMPLQEVSLGVETTLNTNTFEKAGYKFREWNEKADGTGISYSDGASITVSKDTVLYAIWDIASYIIEYDADGGVISDTEVEKTYGTPVSLTTPTKVGYTFEGWYSNKEKTKLYDGNTDISVKGNVRVFIYAKWKPIKYKIKLNPNGQIGSVFSDDYDYDEKVTLANPGYTSSTLFFAGWNEESDGSGRAYGENEEVSKLKQNEGDEVELFAVWTSNIFKIKYNGNGSTSGTMPNQNVQVGNAVELKENIYIKDGYKFVGWNSRADGTGINYGKGGAGSVELSFSLSAGEVRELFAKWEEISYTLVLNANGKTGSDFSHSYKWSENIELDNKGNFTGNGEYLVAWNTESDGSGTKYFANENVSKLAGVDGNTVTLYAMWSSNVYFIKFNADGGQGTMEDQVVEVGSTKTPLKKNKFTKKGHTFGYWESDGGYFFDDHIINEDMGDVGDTINLTAVWSPKTYRIRYEFNGGTDPNGATGIDKPYGEPINEYYFCYPERENYTFVGWYTDSNFTNYYDGTEDIEDGELDEVPIYAKWQPETIIYWYIEDTTKLHLSSTVPTSANYVAGQEIKDLRFGTQIYLPDSYAIKEIIIDNKIAPYSLNHFFEWYDAVETITNIENIDTTNVEIMDNMFCGCRALKSLDLSSFNTNKVVSMKKLFQYCEALEKIEVSSSFVVKNKTKTAGMFNNCVKLKGGNNTPYNSNHTDGEYARVDTALTPGYFTNKENTTNLDYVLPYGWYDSVAAGKTEKNITKITLLKNPDPKPVDVDAEWDISGSNGLKGCIKGTEVFIYAPQDKTIYAPQNCDHLFSGRGDETIGEETGWSKFFSKCEEINNLNYLDTSKVTNMYAMFQGVGMFNLYNPSSHNETVPDDIYNLIPNAKKTVIDVTSFDISNVTNMGRMFELSAIEEIDVSNFDTADVLNMRAMFAQAGLLKDIDISNWDMKKVTNGNSMFTLCLSLKTIDLTGLSFDAADDFAYMFNECPELETIYASNTFFINSSASTGGMFSSCPKLKGGNGTTITGNPVDGTYARVDTAVTPGYFKDKNAAPVTPVVRELLNIEIANDTANKTKYKVGESFDPTGLKIKLNYSDSTSDTVTYSASNASEFTFEPSGALAKTNTSIKIKYAEKEVNQAIEVIELKSISIKASPSKINYSTGEMFNPAGLKLELTYSDDTTKEEVEYNNTTKADFVFSKTTAFTEAGGYNQVVTITYKGKTADLQVKVKFLQNIEIANDTANKTKYKVGETFNPVGLKIKLNYSDNTSNTVTYSASNASEFTFEPSGSLTKSNNSVKIKYAEKEVNQTIEVIELKSISIKASPSKINYSTGETFNPVGLKLELTYSDDTTKEEVEYNNTTKNDFSFSKTTAFTEAGGYNQVVTITYKGKTADLQVKVKFLQNIEIANDTTNKTKYKVGESFDPMGLKIKLNYSDSTSDTVTYSASNASEFTFEPSGALAKTNTSVKIKYAAKEVNQTIEVIELKSISIKASPSKINYSTGETFNPAGLKIELTYSDDTTKEEVEYNNTTKNDFSFSKTAAFTEAGGYNQVVTITYKGKTVDLVVKVKFLQNIEIANDSANKTKYKVGETFNPLGLKLKLNYSDNTSNTVTYSSSDTNWSFTPSGALAKTNTSVKIKYAEKEVNQAIEVIELKSISIKASPSKINYSTGETFNPTGLKLELTYSDDTTKEEVEYNNTTKADFSFSKTSAFTEAGGYNQVVTITYKGKTADLQVKVKFLQNIEIANDTANKTKYKVGESFDPMGLKIKLNYNDNTSSTITYSSSNANWSFTPSGALAKNNTSVKIKYAEKEVNQTIEVIELKSISIKASPSKINYSTGETFNPAGLKLELTYSDDTTKEEVEYNNSTKNDFAFSKTTAFAEAGGYNQVVTITYKGKTVDLAVKVKFLQNIEIANDTTNKTKYKVGETFNPVGLKIKLNYSDNTSNTVTYSASNASEFTFEPNNALAKTNTSVKVKYAGKVVNQAIEVIELKSISIKASPSKINYSTGETFNPAGLKLELTYSDDTTKEEVEYNNTTKNDFSFSKTAAFTEVGGYNQVVTITYKGKTADLQVKVKFLQNIAVDPNSTNKTTYKEGEKYDPTGLKLILSYSDNTSNTVTYSSSDTNWSFTPNGALSKNTNSVTIKYAGKTVSQSIQIIEISGIRKIASPSKLTYIVDDTFNPAGLNIEIKYTDNSTKEIIYNDNTKNDFSFNPSLSSKLTKENQEITITYSGKTVKQNITILNKTLFTFDLQGHGNSFKEEVIENEKLNKPSDPTALGYDFEYWYEDDNTLDEFDFDELLTATSLRNRTLKAKWKAKIYTITYFIGEDATISELSFDKTYDKVYANELAEPERNGYVFEGWYIDKETYKNEYTKDKDIYENGKTKYYIYAKWTEITNNNSNNRGSNNSGNSGGTGGGRGGTGGGIPNNNMLPNNQMLAAYQSTQQGTQQINKSSYGTEAVMQRAAITNIVANTNGLQTTYTNDKGEKLQGMQKVNVNGSDGVYYFNDDATLYCGWMMDENNNYHYFGDGGKMLTNTQVQVNNVTYNINEQGEVVQNNLNQIEKQQLLNQCNVKLQTGTAKVNPLTNTWTVTVTNPVTGEQELAKGLTKLVQDDGINTYYFDNNGNMLTGYQLVNNIWMFFSLENGKLIDLRELQLIK